MTTANRKRADFETREALEARLAAYAKQTRSRATRPVGASVPANITVLAGPRMKVRTATIITSPRRKTAAG